MSPLAETTDPLIMQVEGLKKYFPVRRGFWQRVVSWVKAVDGVDLAIAKGQTLGLVGESGCGKSTVARLILKLLEPDAGRILYRGQDITNVTPQAMKPLRSEIQIVFQDPYGSLNPRMTVGQSIAEGLRITAAQQAVSPRDRVAELLKMVGMSPDSADRYPHEFSGGQRQRIGIARALSVDPALIICDEPISALDVSIQAQIINLLKDLQDQLGLSYLFISHDLNVVGYLCNQVAVMYQGLIVELAETDRLYDHPQHPYTLSLLAAIPDPTPGSSIQATAGAQDTPAPAALPPGCRFQPHCNVARDDCQQDEAPLREVSEGHFVRCWNI
jgi:oligopeptide/dipeptide ABC transporter ATP-binding protein